MGVYEVSLMIYQTFLSPVIFFSILFYMLALSWLWTRRGGKIGFGNKNVEWPTVSVHLPVYNDPVVIRCIKHCMKFDYPKDKLRIMVADDSTDDTSELINGVVKRFPGRINVFRRQKRTGYKAGALNNVLKHDKSEIIVLFDSDFTPSSNLLKRLVRPLVEDKKVAFAQSRMGYINHDQNLITRLASAFMMVYHQLILPLTNKFGVNFFCGTGGAIRRGVLLEMGGWNEKSLTEDADISMKIINAGYKSVYLPNVRVRGEFPFTFDSFFKQQTRWTYGMTRVFIENFKSIWLGSKLSLFQRALITYVTVGSIAAPFVSIMTIGGIVSLSTGTPHALSLKDFFSFAQIFAYTGGFLVVAFISLSREKKLLLFKSVVFGALTVGVLISMVITLALTRAVLGLNTTWFRTPKFGSLRIIELFKKYFKMWSEW